MNARSVEESVAGILQAHAGRVFVGFSGGLDSTLLLHLAAASNRNRVVALHINHGLNPRADSWQRHCQVVSEALGVECVVKVVTVTPTGSVEAAARQARYAAFVAILQPGDLLLLGHHLDDQAETMLWRLLRGGGSAALAGMVMRRPLGCGELVRPLLDHSRDELETCARARGLTWIDDDSNADVRFVRNYMRHEVLPVLRRRWPDVAARLGDAARKFGAEAHVLQRALELELDRGGATLDMLPVALLGAGSKAQLLLRQWLARAGIAGVRERVLAEIVRQVHGAADRAPDVVVAAGTRVRRFHEHLHLVAQSPETFEPLSWTLGNELVLPNGILTSTRGFGVGLRADLVDVVVRPRGGGERLRLAGGRGSRSVKRLLQQAQLPPWQRAGYPLLFVGGCLAAVPGIVVAEEFVDDAADVWQLAWRSRGFRDARREAR